ncbi:23S rRNA (uracil(1939)-C(5))-methyltransferase RlmD [Lacrimispora sp. NSJ-141]|uniref:23S rRNA (Uracil(1939)-C(5))-methyltransferase RlmD n=1 Tax=Lientehia hominis TaxID=2897778 RepID=A0AAP2RIT9_9FIRM|nr:23S rRNA (uracil(1939)-C(5))-methyltransferase RlmD [Lientehia hominis]MCD2492772.1 23S rRNA (uracil(1939)-C(5))-methyltransferase RlmD [Lientehia hominis]
MSQLKGEKRNKQFKAPAAKGKETPEYEIHSKKTGLRETFSESKGNANTGKRKPVSLKTSYAAAASDGRRRDQESFCPVSMKCGGCEYQRISYEEQLRMKQKMVESLLKGICRVHPIIGMKDPFHYRNKVHAVFDRKKDGTVISGVYERNSHRVVPIDDCLIEDEQADAIIRDIRGLLKSFKIRIFDEDTGYGLLRHVLIRRGFSSGEVLVVLVLSSPILPSKNNFVKALRALHPEITTVVLNVNDKRTSMVLGEREITLYGKGYIEDTLCGKVFRISPRSFYQVNPVQTEVLYGKAIELAGLTGKERVIDAYCGIGTIGLTASSRAGEVIGVELSKDAVRDAIANAKRNDVKNVRFYQNDAGEFMSGMAEQRENADVVFMDPPRQGSDEAFLSSVLRLAPKRIVYISCNPETLARDLKYLVQRGYRAEGAWPVDMFPWTGHVECVVQLTRIK